MGGARTWTTGGTWEAGSPVHFRRALAFGAVLTIALAGCASREPTVPPPDAITQRPVQKPGSTIGGTQLAPPTAKAKPGTPGPVAAPGAKATESAFVPPRPPLPTTNPSAPNEVFGTVRVHTAKYEDTFADLAIAYDTGYVAMLAANPGVDPWLPGAGTKIVLPRAAILPSGSRDGVVINMPEQRLFIIDKGRLVDSFPIGIGRDGFHTPYGTTKVVRKTAGPTWYPTASTRKDDPELPAVVPPGPENPMGTHALYLGWPTYAIHGTNRPFGIGRRVSRGCIRMQNEDVVKVFQKVPVGMPVTVVNEPVKVGWWQGELFIEAHPTIEQGLALDETGSFEPEADAGAKQRAIAEAGEFAERIDWATVDKAIAERRGIPVQITNIGAPVQGMTLVADAAPKVTPVADKDDSGPVSDFVRWLRTRLTPGT